MTAANHNPSIAHKYHFRLRFCIPDGRSVDCAEKVIDIPTGCGRTLRLTGESKSAAIKSARWFILTGDDYTSHEEAKLAGMKARHALRIVSIKSGIPIDLGKDRASGGFSDYAKDKIQAETGIRVINDVHGLLIYDVACETRFARFSASPTVSTSASRFLALFEEAYAAGLALTDKQEVASALLAATGFERSPRGRFLTLVMAIEALLEPEDRQETAQNHVRLLIGQTRESALASDERDSLMGSLQWLLKESITKTGKKLAARLLGERKYADKNPASFFGHCYTLRSQLVHNGSTTDQSTDISATNSELRRFVTDLLDASIRANAT